MSDVDILRVGSKVIMPLDDEDTWIVGTITAFTPDKLLAYVEMMKGTKKGYIAVRTTRLKLLPKAEETTG